MRRSSPRRLFLRARKARALGAGLGTLGLLVATAACSYLVELPSDDTQIPDIDGSIVELDASSYVDPDSAPLPPLPPFCESQPAPPLFCADFDGPTAPVLTEIGELRASGGELSVANAIALSPPRSVVGTASGDVASVILVPTLDVTPERVTVSSSILVSTFTTSDADLMQIELAPGDGGTLRCFVRLTAAATWSVTQVCLDGAVETARQATDSGQPVERRRWHRFTLGLSVAPPKTVTLAVDGAAVVEVAALDAMTASPTTAGFGVVRSAGGEVAVFYDDLLVTSP